MSPGGRVVPLRHLARQIWRLLDASQKRECMFVLLISIAAGCLTLFGVAGIAPFLAVLADPSVVGRNPILERFAQMLPSSSPDDFAIWLGGAFVGLLVLSNVVNLLATLTIGRFSHRVGARLQAALFAEYLHRDLRFHAGSNSDVLATRVVHDASRTVGSLIRDGLLMLAGAVSIGLIAAAVIG